MPPPAGVVEPKSDGVLPPDVVEPKLNCFGASPAMVEESLWRQLGGRLRIKLEGNVAFYTPGIGGDGEELEIGNGSLGVASVSMSSTRYLLSVVARKHLEILQP
jgi:hypothetical protein